ncbi:MAG: hypothetical protein N0E48_14395 [Candidatus Thiodiazotropha endolucinida]|nr:hypothetical protein [Candidatus Thiodiazotropha endolucinida]
MQGVRWLCQDPGSGWHRFITRQRIAALAFCGTIWCMHMGQLGSVDTNTVGSVVFFPSGKEE